MKKVVLGLAAVVVLAIVAVFCLTREDTPVEKPTVSDRESVNGAKAVSPREIPSKVSKRDVEPKTEVATETPAESETPPAMTEEEKREAAEEKLVDAFDAETDRWMDAEKTKPPTMAEVEKFRTLFKSIPKERKEECLHRALNLVPDANVMLLAGILMDKTEDRELVELVFNDILNRDEEVKKPILQTLFKDKTHPCWADTAWIMDVTGEKPQK